MLTLDRPPFLTDLLSIEQIESVVHRFYDKVYADPLLSPLFEGVARARQEQRLAGFVRMTRGRRNVFDADFLKTAHARLPITTALLVRRAQLLADSITESGHGEEVVACWKRYDAIWWRDVMGR